MLRQYGYYETRVRIENLSKSYLDLLEKIIPDYERYFIREMPEHSYGSS